MTALPNLPRAMTDAEALMWSVEADPWLDPSGGSITFFDRPLDIERFRRDMARTIAATPRLRQRVVSPTVPLAPPHWETDREFSLDWHVRYVRAPGHGTQRDVLEWLNGWLQEPYDRSRALWQFVVLDGLEGGGGALANKLHHVLLDGAAAVAMSEHYAADVRDPDEPPEVDLDALIAAEPEEAGGLRAVVADAVERPLAAGRRLLDQLAHPERMLRMTTEVVDLLRSAGDQLRGAGAPLWRERSRHRAMEVVTFAFSDLRAAAKRLGGSLNDLFITAMVTAADRYHADEGTAIEHVHLTFVVSTRADRPDATNAFTPVPVDLPVPAASLAERFERIQAQLGSRRQRVHGEGPFAAMASLAVLLPTPVVTSIARNQAATIDIATSNLPGPLQPTYIAGAQVEETYVFGPVAGTAVNATLFTTAGRVGLGLHIDPAAITEPGRFRDHVEDAIAELVALK